VEAASPPAPAAATSSRSAVLNAVAVAVVALSTGGQVALYLRDFGATHRTDGLIAAFAIYSLVVVLGQLLRTTAVPLLSGARAAVAPSAFGWAVTTAGVLVAIIVGAVSVPLGDAIAGASGSAGRSIAVSSLWVMAPAMGLQIMGAGLAVKGAIDERIDAVAAAYMVSALVGVVAFLLLRSAADETVLAWTMLASSLVLTVGLVLATRLRVAPPPSPRLLVGALVALARSLPLPASFIAMYPLTLALLPPGHAGQITLYGLSYGACSYLVGFTGQALSMTDAVTLSRTGDDASERRRDLVTRSFRYSLLLSAAGVGVAAVAGAPVLGKLLPSHSDPNGYFGTDILLLIPWLVATLALWATLPAVLSRAHGMHDRRVGVAVVGLIAIHVVAVLVGRAIAGFDGAIVAMALAPSAFVVAGVWVAVPGAAGAMARPATVIIALAVIGFGIPAALDRAVAGAAAGGSVLAAGLGAVAYGVLSARAYPEVVRSLVRVVRRSR
jgi:hypothetical protein